MRTSATLGLVSVREMADLLGVTRATVQRLCAAGVLPSKKIAGVVKIDADRLTAALKSHATKKP